MRFTGRYLWGAKVREGWTVFEWAAAQLSAQAASFQRSSITLVGELPNLAAKLISLHHTNPFFTFRHVTEMAFSSLGAGTETIGITLSAVLCNIIQRPELQVKLQKEIDDACKEGRLTFSSEGIVKIGHSQIELKLLDATLRESMRLHPVAGVPFPRVVGKEGMMLEGLHIPGGTTVGVNPWVMGRSTELYGPDAEEFKPERWLSISRVERTKIDNYDQTFGVGLHSCPGKHLARAILYKILSMLLMHYTWHFEDANRERETECMFGVRWKDVKIMWSVRNVKT